MEKSLVSFYEGTRTQVKKDINLENYIGMIKHGTWQDSVLSARALKQAGDIEGYKKIKDKAFGITGSCIINEGARTDANIKTLNGFIVIDIDNQINLELVNDKYTAILHRSFGGDGMAIFVRINPDKFLDSFNGLAQYYLYTYQITIDPSCKNKSRFRYISYDPDIYVNEKSAKFIAKDVKKFEAPKDTNFVYTSSDFDHILQQIKDRNIDLCQENYQRFLNIGFALLDKFGSSGAETYHFICQFGNKYKREDTQRKWDNLCKTSQGKVKIGAFYYYCKDAGLEIYSPKTKAIINRVKVSKSQGNPTVESISKNLLIANEIVVDKDDEALIKELIESNVDFSKEVKDRKSVV